MAPSCTYLLEQAGVTLPVLGLYDVPAPTPFEPLVRPAEGRWACVFMFYPRWLKGERLHLTRDNYGCGGAGKYLFGAVTRTRDEYIEFLCGEEGLKASGDLMGQWLDAAPCYRPEHEHIVIGPLQDDQYDRLRAVTFLVNPDQLSLFVTGAHYRHGPPTPRVTAPFAAGCGLLGPVFEDPERPEALIGATDIAMRRFLPPDILTFTVTRPLYEELCALDGKSFLDKAFWKEVVKARARRGQAG